MTPASDSPAERIFDRLRTARMAMLPVLAAPWMWAGSLLLVLALLLLASLAPEVTRTLRQETIGAERGRAFRVRIPDELPFVVRGSSTGTRQRGLTLFEDGYPLGPVDARHDLIRETGNGAYSHWSDTLYFSSTDGSDPRTNGRVYSYRAFTALHPALRLIGYAAFVVGLLGIASNGERLRPDNRASRALGQRLARNLSIIAIVSGVVGLTYLCLLSVTAPPLHATIDPAAINAPRGNAYTARVDPAVQWPLRAAASFKPFDQSSAFSLTENGRLLGPVDTDPAAVARDGSGRYALFADQLVFSTPDGSDPRANGRAYAWLVPVKIVRSAWLLAFFALAAGVLLARRQGVVLPGTWLLRPAPSDDHLRKTARGALVVCLVCIAAVGLVVSRWNWGPSAQLGVMGYLPVSDALGYLWCGVLSGGSPPAQLFPPDWTRMNFDWCARRVLYVTVLGSTLGLSGWRPQLVLLVQALLVGGALAAFAITVARCYGRIVATVSLAGLMAVAHELALATFMTESLGLPLGILGMTLLLAFAAGDRRLTLLYGGLAIFSCGMFARMGALLVLPMLGLWACCLLLRSGKQGRLLACAGVILTLAAGPVLQVLMALALGVDPANTGGNYATTLYGLSTGSRDWHQAYRDFGPVFQSMPETKAFAQVYAVALANIVQKPGVFIYSLAIGTLSFLVDAYSVTELLLRSNRLLSALGLTGVAWCVAHWKNPLATLPLAVLLGELASVPLVFTGASDHRVLVVSLGARFLLAGIGLAWLWHVAQRFFTSSARPSETRPSSRSNFATPLAASLAAAVIVAAILPATPIQRLFALPAVQGRGCPAGQEELVARVGRESMAVAAGNAANLGIGRVLEVDPRQLAAERIRQDLWWARALPQLDQTTTLIFAIQLRTDRHGALFGLIFDGQLPGTSYSPISFCYDPTPTSTVIGVVDFRRAISARLLTGP
jgi:hypothetical protein